MFNKPKISASDSATNSSVPLLAVKRALMKVEGDTSINPSKVVPGLETKGIFVLRGSVITLSMKKAARTSLYLHGRHHRSWKKCSLHKSHE